MDGINKESGQVSGGRGGAMVGAVVGGRRSEVRSVNRVATRGSVLLSFMGWDVEGRGRDGRGRMESEVRSKVVGDVRILVEVGLWSGTECPLTQTTRLASFG